MTATTAINVTEAPSRTPLLAALGVAASALLTAVGTFWDVTGNESGDNNSFSEYWPVLIIIAVTAAVVFGLVVRGAEAGNPGRRSLVLGIVSVLSNVVFWAGLPMVLVAGAVACALAEKETKGAFGTGSKVAFGLSLLATAAAVSAAIAG